MKHTFIDIDGRIAASTGLCLAPLPVDMAQPFARQVIAEPHECYAWSAAVADSLPEAQASTVFRTPTDGGLVARSIRSSSSVTPSVPALASLYDRMDAAAAANMPVFDRPNVRLSLYRSQHLVYHTGDHFVRHADNAIGIGTGWRHNTPGRDMVGICWLTDHVETAAADSQSAFAGGAFVFDSVVDDKGQPARVLPRAGEWILFPAHPNYLHSVARVTAGRRITISRWYTIHDA
jgi:predicted 2-oxoglutarate/Fe(II)-dependent dioxygenase YbiX